MKKYFGTDGIRGKANTELSISLASKVGQSLKALNNKQLVVGYDTRESNKLLACAIISGALSVGIDVNEIGVISTPGIAYCSKKLNSLGVIITASHNPYDDNGIKIFNCGEKLTSLEEQLLEEMIDSNIEVTNEIGKFYENLDVLNDYINFLKKNNIDSESKIILDLANGATSTIAPIVFNDYPNVSFIGNNPNGTNINKDVGATSIKTIQKLIIENHYDIGLAFDGDGDRIIVLDDSGKVFNGDMLIYIYANYLKSKNLLKNNGVVLTSMSNLGIINSLENKGINVYLSDVGDKNVYNMILKNDLVLGGEHSGHIIINDLLNTGDGILSGLFLLKILKETKSSLQELTKDVILYPEKHLNIKLDKTIVNDPRVQKFIEDTNTSFDGKGQLIIRASGTEDLIRIKVSHYNLDVIDDTINLVNNLLSNIIEEGNKNG